MGLQKKLLCYISLLLVTLMVTPSCGLAKMSKLNEQIKILSIENVEIKGMTGLLLSVELRNDSKLDVTMRDAVVKITTEGEPVVTLVQVGEATALATTTGTVSALWRVEQVNTMTMLTIAARIMQSDYTKLEADYSAELTAGKVTRTISDENVDLTKFMATFAK